MSDEEKKEETNKLVDFIKKHITWIFIVVILFWIISFIVALRGDVNSRGTFGDAFGSVNAL
ncbi:MAG: hypothetical protein KAR06_02335, partial [Deltaproteobacteria bacterium]|nr:hypothetical protein [Deltaproteobacteria bacterium]